MRDYKFRGKRVDNGEWVYGYYDGCYETATINYLKVGVPYNACVISETVGQYTGKNDKNDREIYEKHRVKVQFEGAHLPLIIGEVVFEEGQWMVKEDNGEWWNLYSSLLEQIEIIDEVEEV